MSAFLVWIATTFLAPMPLVAGVALGALARREKYILFGSAVLAILLVWFQLDMSVVRGFETDGGLQDRRVWSIWG